MFSYLLLKLHVTVWFTLLQRMGFMTSLHACFIQKLSLFFGDFLFMLYVPEHVQCLCVLKISSLHYFGIKRLDSLFFVHSQLVAFSL